MYLQDWRSNAYLENLTSARITLKSMLFSSHNIKIRCFIMNIQVEGDHKAASEVLKQIQDWDAAVVALNIDDVVEQCTDQVSLFDVGSQLTGTSIYRKAWEQFSPYFSPSMKITRRHVTLYCSKDLAFMHCYSKVEDTDETFAQAKNMPWCRTTLCLQKKNDVWLVVHQHISMPVNMSSGSAIVIQELPTLSLVI